jgi:GMP synthase (glutamine-hydrolysing)
MKKPILVLQFRTDKSLQHERDMYLTQGGFKKSQLVFKNILDNRVKVPTPKDLTKYSAVIIGASGEFNITDWPKSIQKKINRIKPLLNEILKTNFPTLAVCFGHQMLAHMAGGKVVNYEKNAEAGSVKITVTKEGKKVNLYKDVPSSFWALSGHKDSVVKLPKGAKILASSQKCKINSYKLGENIYSIQYHPELDIENLIWRLKLYPEYLKGKPLSEIRKQYKEVPYATKILDNFRQLIYNNN